MKEYIPARRKEIYVRDARGNVLAVYEAVGESLFTKEYYIYGVQRLGYLMERRYLGRRCSRPPCLGGPPVDAQRVLGLPPGIGRPSVVVDDGVELVRGSRRYELSDWLGNVRVVVTDARVPIRWRGVVVGYRAEVVSVGDYYSFGAEIRERSYEIASVYRYGYQAQERDDEVYGRGASYYYKYRQHDARLGRFWSVDPLARKYPWNSPYAFAENDVVSSVELEGLERVTIQNIDRKKKTADVIITKRIYVQKSEDMPKVWLRINPERVRENFQRGNTTIRMTGIIGEEEYTFQVRYDVRVLFRTKEELRSIDVGKDMGLNTIVRPISPYMGKLYGVDENTVAIGGIDKTTGPGIGSVSYQTVLVNPSFRYDPKRHGSFRYEDALTHEVGYHNMMGKEDGSSYAPEGLGSNKEGMVYPLLEETKEIIRRAKGRGNIEFCD